MANTPDKSINSFKNGLNLSADNINQPKDTYSYALNAIKEDSVNNPEILTNEKGFIDYIDLGYDYILLGYIFLGEKNYVLFVKNLVGDSDFNKIVLVQDTSATTIYNTTDLNFHNKYPIKGTYRINFKNERIIYWVDGLNEDRVLNIDRASTGDVDELSLDIKYIPAILSSRTVEDNGGNLVTGTYEFFGSYKSVDNAITPWFLLTANPIYIIDDDTQASSLANYIAIDGCDSNLPTNKSVILELSNLDTRFSKFRLGIIKTINGVKTAYYVDNITFTDSTKEYIYTGNSTEIIIPDISSVTVDTVKYFASNAIIQVENRLIRANTSSNKVDIGYQIYANNIGVDYYIEEELCGSMADTTDYNTRSEWWKSANTKYSDKKSLMRDEVYSLGIAFGLIKEGVETEVYHIPGRAINTIPNTTYRNQYNNTSTIAYSSTWDSANITENGETIPTWKVVNTAASNEDSTINKLAYWESSEVYPDGLDLPITGSSTTGVNNTPIRHHKMPSGGLEPIFRLEDTGGTLNFYKRHLGLTFSNIVVPDDLLGNISYIRIYISPRDRDQNKSIIAKGIFTNCSLTKINTTDFDTVSDTNYIHPCAPYNDLTEATNGDCYKDGQDSGWDTTSNFYHSFYSPDTTLASPVVNGDRVLIENEYTGIVHYYNTLAGLINADPYTVGSDGHTDSSTNGGYKRDLFFDDNGHGRTYPTGQTSSKAVYNVTTGYERSTYKSISILNNINQISTSKSRRKLKQSVYVPFNAKLSVDQIGGMDNPYISEYGASNVLLELNPLYTNLGATETTDTSVKFTDNDNTHNYTNPDQDSDISGTFHFHTIANPLAVYRYGSLKRTNSSQYGNIDNIEYNPTELVIANPTFDGSNVLIEELSGLIGDSWIDMYSVKRTRWVQKESYTFGGKPEVSTGISTFFTESNINHRLRYAEGTDFRTYYPKQILTTPIKQYLDAGLNKYIFYNDNYYKENTDFNEDSTKKNYGLGLIDINTAGITNYITRILYSEQQLDESIIDNYRVFLANNYRDLPKNTGFITHLFKRNQEFYAVTRDALWKVFASNETIRTDISSISIGNGEFMSLEPIELLSIEGGFGGSSSKSSLVETPYGYGFIDKNKGKVILFRDKQGYYDNGQQGDISIQGVYNFTNNNFILPKDETVPFDTPLANSGYISGYDSDVKRLLITKLDYQLTNTQDTFYRGIFNPEATYTTGDIYKKDDGSFYIYNSTTTGYNTIVDSGDLSDFVQAEIDVSDFTFTTPSFGTATKIDNNTLRYTYTGTDEEDSFNITMNCDVTNVLVDAVALPAESTIDVNNNTTNFTIAFVSLSGGPGSYPNITTVGPGDTRTVTILSGTYTVGVKVLSSIDGGTGVLTISSSGTPTTYSISSTGATVSQSASTHIIVQLDPP